jgi:DNA-binding HxlR family transcriptional regulator
MDNEAPQRVEAVLGSIAAKWKPTILFFLVTEGTLRFGELRARIPAVSQRMLTQQLRDLERNGLVRRQFFEQIPPRVEYSVTELALSLDPIFKSLCGWATEHYKDVQKAQRAYDRAHPKSG